MFVSKRAFVVFVSLALAAGCTAAEVGSEENGSSDAPAMNGEGAGNGSEGASSSSGASGGGSSSGGSSSGGSSSGGSSSGGSSSGGSSSGGPAVASFTCQRCSSFAASEANGGPGESWAMCDGEYHWGQGYEPKSYELYTAYLGCLCSGPCVNECETSLCALVPTTASQTCKSCLALNNAACSTQKSACLADQ